MYSVLSTSPPPFPDMATIADNLSETGSHTSASELPQSSTHSSSADEASSSATSDCAPSPPALRASERIRHKTSCLPDATNDTNKPHIKLVKLQRNAVAKTPKPTNQTPRRTSPRSKASSRQDSAKSTVSSPSGSSSSTENSTTTTITASPSPTVQGYGGNYVFRAEWRNGIHRVVRYELEPLPIDPPLQDWEGDGMLQDGLADPDSNWLHGPRVLFNRGIPSTTTSLSVLSDVRPRYSPKKAKTRPRAATSDESSPVVVTKKTVTKGKRKTKGRRPS